MLRKSSSPLLALEPNDSKIVGGVEAVPHAYPYVVAIFIDEIYFCGGTIIGDIGLNNFNN